jgi:hypothetical protein
MPIAMMQRIARSMKKLIWITLIVVLLGGCAWFSLVYLAWQIPPAPKTHSIALADLDADGDLDAFLANGRNEAAEPNTVLWNDGQGHFQNSGQQLGSFESWDVLLSDFDRDGDTDALVSNIAWGEYFWNDGRGQFQQSQSVSMPDREGYPVGIWRFEAADLNGDNRVDLFLTGCCGGGVSTDQGSWHTLNASNSICLSDGQGLPRDTGQKLGLGSSEAVALADLDADGDLDAFVANSSYQGELGDPVAYDPNRVWLNDGQGTFRDSGQQLGHQRSYAIAEPRTIADGRFGDGRLAHVMAESTGTGYRSWIEGRVSGDTLGHQFICLTVFESCLLPWGCHSVPGARIPYRRLHSRENSMECPALSRDLHDPLTENVSAELSNCRNDQHLPTAGPG